MNIFTVKPDPNACPLCGKPNNCMNLTDKNPSLTCWCNSPSITFTKELLSLIPEHLKGKACVCKMCVLNHQVSKSK